MSKASERRERQAVAAARVLKLTHLYTRRILRTYRQATAEDVRTGGTWYADARELAEYLDPNDVQRAAGVIAVLSPLTDWATNVRNACAAYDGEPILTLGRNRAKARALVNGKPLADNVRGPKVSAFWRAICGLPGPVTLDRHAIDICLGSPLGNDEGHAREGSLSYGGRKAMLAAYVRAAELAGTDANTLQAITWVAWRGIHRTSRREVAAYAA